MMKEYKFGKYDLYEMDCKTIDKNWILEINEKKYVVNIDVKNFIDKYLNNGLAENEIDKLDETDKQIFNLLKEVGYFSDDDKNIKKKNNDYARLIFKKRLFSQKSLRHLWPFKIIFSKPAVMLIIPLIIANIIYSCMNKGITNTSNVFIILILLIIAAVFHEIGHISASIKFGIVPRWAGVGIYFVSPVTFVDVDNTWKLKQRERLIVDIGGIYFQLIIALIYSVIYLIFNKIVFLQVSSLLIISALFNLNPFLKYDGYWILSDILGVYNLNKQLAVSIKILLNNIFKKEKINNFNYTNFKNYIIGVYSLISMYFYLYFSYRLIYSSVVGIYNIIFKFSFYGLFINFIFLFFAFFSIKSLFNMIKQVIFLKIVAEAEPPTAAPTSHDD